MINFCRGAVEAFQHRLPPGACAPARKRVEGAVSLMSKALLVIKRNDRVTMSRYKNLHKPDHPKIRDFLFRYGNVERVSFQREIPS